MKKLKKLKKSHIKILLFTLLVIFILVYYIIEVRIKPVLASICEVRARIIATQAINNAIKTELQKDDLKEQLIVSTYDNEGKINMISTNANIMNILSANITANVQGALKGLTKQPFSINLGYVLNNWLLPDLGPELEYNIIPQGSVLVDFITEFEESGINQTRYKIFITVTVEIRVISPAVTNDTYTVS
ncbi:sporulation protein YunB [Sedimentibacter sp. zth1]|uniref:sporulation protein YunB n=1 Tax=Sedimentibacter sp. zth1 TaxID=2816908 RepID=UPI001A935A73|nr:sporulation protein YunB [Sedimentibacter sp. zth1]QSX06392.1 sporulation protein YunB [Sedimentibacter sp. zth1]